MNTAARITIAATEIAGTVGVPFVGLATAPLREILEACDQVAIQKAKSIQIKQMCTALVNSIREHDIQDTLIQDTATQMENVLLSIRDKMQKIAGYNRVKTFRKRAKIGHILDKCIAELHIATTTFQISSHVILHKSQKEMKDAADQAASDMRDLVSAILTSPDDLRSVVQLHDAQVNQSLMREGQQGLSHLRVAYPGVSRDNDVVTSRADIITQGSSHVLRRGSLQTFSDRERYLGHERGLLALHKLTGIPPSVKILDGEIVRTGSAVAGGTYSDVWNGIWLGEFKVALKALRNVKAQPNAKARFLREIIIWERLVDENVLPFFGIVSNLGPYLHMVSPWQDEGNVLEYAKKHPHVDKLHLLHGAAKGIAYLHSQNVVHGNVRCSNVLVSNDGSPLICDFGISKVIADVTGVLASTTLSQLGSSRWLAPEVIQGGSPTYQSDTYSYGMTILELLTGNRPYAHKKTDPSVIIAIVNHEPPVSSENRVGLISDLPTLPRLLDECWQKHDGSRPLMSQVVRQLQAACGTYRSNTV